MQRGSLMIVSRKQGPDVWQFRWSERDLNRRRVYQPLFPPEELGDAGRVRWVSGTPGQPPAYAGTDFIVARNGRIASVYLIFDNLPLKAKCATSSETLDDEWAVRLLDADRIGPIVVFLCHNASRVRAKCKDPGQQRIFPKN
jgi:hypothetical protein